MRFPIYSQALPLRVLHTPEHFPHEQIVHMWSEHLGYSILSDWMCVSVHDYCGRVLVYACAEYL